MKDEEKTNALLIDELKKMREQIKELESKLAMMEGKKDELYDHHMANRSERKDLLTHIEFITDFDIVEARGINISEGGISFELYEDLPFEMRFTMDGKLHEHRANLVWVKRIPGGGFRFGLSFIRPRKEITF